MKTKKISNELLPYVTRELIKRKIAYQLQDCGVYSIIALDIKSAKWNTLIWDAKYNLTARKKNASPDRECYLPVVSVHTLKNGKKMKRLHDVFSTHCFFINDEQAEIVKYLYA